MEPQEPSELSAELPSVWFNRLAEGERKKAAVTPNIGANSALDSTDGTATEGFAEGFAAADTEGKSGLGLDGIYYSSKGVGMQENRDRYVESVSNTRVRISSDMNMPSFKSKLDLSRVRSSTLEGTGTKSGEIKRSSFIGVASDVVDQLSVSEVAAIRAGDARGDVMESESSSSSSSSEEEEEEEEEDNWDEGDEKEGGEGEGKRRNGGGIREDSGLFGEADDQSFSNLSANEFMVSSKKVEFETVVVKRYRKHHWCNCGTCLPKWFPCCVPSHISKNPFHPKRWRESKEHKEEEKKLAVKKKQLEKLKKQASKIIQSKQQEDIYLGKTPPGTPNNTAAGDGDGDANANAFLPLTEQKRQFFQERMARGSIIGTLQHKHRHKRSTLNLEKASLATLTGNFGEDDEEGGGANRGWNWARVKNVIVDNYFLVLMIVMILLAMPYPYLGTSSGPLQTKWSVSYGVNIIVFFISGLTLKTEELVNAFKSVKLNVCIQCITFGVVPFLFWLIYLLLKSFNFHQALAEGFCILGCLPMTVNMCYVLTTSANGDSSAALLNATLGNIIGTFVSPLLILGMLNVAASVSYGSVLVKLLYKVLIPLIVGQAVLQLQHKYAFIKAFVKFVKPHGKRVQETLLGLIVWSSFSNTFYHKLELPFDQVMIILGVVVVAQCLIYVMNWVFFSLKFLKFTEKQKVAGFYCSSAKTMAMGLPLIVAMYEEDPNLGIYSVPLLMYHPCLMLFGSIFLPYLRANTKEEEEKEKQLDVNALPEWFHLEDLELQHVYADVEGQTLERSAQRIQTIQGTNYIINSTQIENDTTTASGGGGNISAAETAELKTRGDLKGSSAGFTTYGKSILKKSGVASTSNTSPAPDVNSTSPAAAAAAAVKRGVTYAPETDTDARKNKHREYGDLSHLNDSALPHEIDQIEQEFQTLMQNMEKGDHAPAPASRLVSAAPTEGGSGKTPMWSTVPAANADNSSTTSGSTITSTSTPPVSSPSMAANSFSRAKLFRQEEGGDL